MLFLQEHASATQIFGTLKDDAHLNIYVAIEDDHITHQHKYLAQSSIAEDGSFELNFQLPDSIRKIYIKTIKHIFTLHVCMNGKYELTLQEPKEAAMLDNKKLLKITSLQESSPKINAEINKIDSLFDAFFEKNFLLMIHPRSIKAASDTFKIKLNEQLKNYHVYSKEYAHFTMASIDHAAGYREKYFFKTYTNYLGLHNHDAYYNYINEHFKNYLEIEIAKTCFGDGKQMINNQHNVPDLLTKIQKCDSLQSIDSLREYLLIAGLTKLYFKREFNKSSIEMMMRYIAFNSHVNENKRATKNFIHRFEQLQVGSKAPDFELISHKADTIKLSQFNGALTYIFFTKFDNFDWQTQLSILERLQLLYEKRVHIICITMDDDLKKMNELWKQKKFAETILNGYNDLALSEAYAIDTLPKYLLLDADGDILKNSNCSPVDGIEEIIKQYLKK